MTNPTEPTADTEPVSLDRLNEQVQRTSHELRKAELVVKARRNRYVDAGRQVNLARENRDAVVRARDSLGAWLDERSRSLSIRLVHHIDDELRRIDADERSMREFGQMRDFAGKARQLRRAFVRAMLRSLGFAIGIPVLLFVIALQLRRAAVTIPILELSVWRYVVLFAILLLIGTFLALLPYHRGFMQMRYELDRNLAWGRNALVSIDRIRSDRARLSELRPQLEERLEFYGAVLQQPWTVSGAEQGIASAEALAEGLPANLRIAEVSDSGEETWNRLLQRLTAEHFKPGLRKQAAARLLSEAARRHGLDPERVTFDFLDRDNLQKDLRLVLMRHASHPEILDRLGRERVVEIAESIQMKISPPRRSSTGDQHHECRGPRRAARRQRSAGRLEARAELLGRLHQRDPRGPIRTLPLAFSGQGQADGEHHRFTSVATGPDRVRERSSVRVSWVDIQSGAVTGTETVTRIDITDPLDVNKVALFSEVVETDEEFDSEPVGLL